MAVHRSGFSFQDTGLVKAFFAMIIHRALRSEVLQTSIAVTLVVISIFLVVRLLSFLRMAADGILPVEGVLVLVGLKLLSSMDVILPLMFYIAMLMTLSRWRRDNEMTVLAACGVGLPGLWRPVGAMALGLILLVSAFSFYLTPMVVETTAKIERQYRARSELAGVVPGMFIETRRGSGVYFVERLDREKDRYENVFVYQSSHKREAVVVAKYGFKHVDDATGDPFLVLKNGTRYEGTPGEQGFRLVDYESFALRIEERSPEALEIPLKGRPTREIIGSADSEAQAEWHWRIAKVVAIPALALFALGFSYFNPRQSNLGAMIAAFAVYFLYSNALGFGVAQLKRGKLPPGAGLWAIHALFLILALLLFHRRAHNRQLLPAWLNLRR
jgi:lipopolysaccharide export system permease protein